MKSLSEEDVELIEKVPVGAIFRHYSGREYKILQIGRESSDLSLYVVYQGLYFSEQFGKYPIWIRPLNEFLETVETNGEICPRFTMTHQPIYE